MGRNKYRQLYSDGPWPKRVRRIVGRYVRRNRAYYDQTFGHAPKDTRASWALMCWLRAKEAKEART